MDNFYYHMFLDDHVKNGVSYEICRESVTPQEFFGWFTESFTSILIWNGDRQEFE